MDLLGVYCDNDEFKGLDLNRYIIINIVSTTSNVIDISKRSSEAWLAAEA